ncbi:MAG TPA: cytochrome c/FTR1 family iron permease [Xanthomonadales bacterium]|nr:cytochrome c/FTR1 family iron permease [Xanthomonadales bacterium]
MANAFRALIGAVVLFLCAGPVAADDAAYPDDQSRAQTIVHLLDYVAVDYPEFVRDGTVLNEAEYAEQAEFAAEVARHLDALAAPSDLEHAASALSASIAAKADGALVARDAISLRDRVIAAFGVAASPRGTPEIALGADVYARSCSGCHGVTGRGDGPAGAALDPKPSDFHDAARMDQRSVFGLYNTITLGVAGTGMAGYATTLDDATRWALAFHVASLRHDELRLVAGEKSWSRETAPPTLQSLAGLVATTATALDEKDRAALAYLTRHPERLQRGHDVVLGEGRTLLEASVKAYRDGDADRAQQLAVDAYLQGFEPIEASLDATAPALRIAVEERMQALRAAIRDGEPADEVAALAAEADDGFAAVSTALGENRASGATAAMSAFLILFREGLEAILVIAAVLALLVRAGRKDAVRWVHAGWIAALALGGVTWLAARSLIDISGATREVTEGVTALVAAAILVYVGFWLHSKSYAQAWQKFIQSHLKGAVSGGTVWALAGVSFLAVYREAFETVLFYEALWAQGGTQAQILGGMVAAVVALLAISLLIFRYGMRLPIGPFFAISSILLALLAVVFTGQGVAALQEAGTLPVDPLPFARVSLLGVFPTVQTTVAQALVLAVVVIGFAWTYRVQRAPAPARS